MIRKKLLLLSSICILFVGCIDTFLHSDDFCLKSETLDPSVRKVVSEYVVNTENKSFILLTATALDFSYFYKRVQDVYVIGPNYSDVIDTLSVFTPSIESHFDGYENIGFKLNLNAVPIYHFHLKGKIIFLQSSFDCFVNDKNAKKYSSVIATNSTDGRHQFMRESLCIIKQPDGEVNSFILGDTILTEDKLRIYFNRHL